MTYIPIRYGHLVDVKLIFPDRKYNMAELWFEDKEGTIRIVTVNKGKAPDFEPLLDNRVRVIPRM